MAFPRKRKRKTGVFWSVIDDGREYRAGSGKKGAGLAKRWAARINEDRLLQTAGLLPPSCCLWTVKDLRAADLEAAVERGARTAFPQLGPESKSHRASHWDSLEAFFPEDTALDEITTERLRQYRREPPRLGRRKKGPAGINRDLAILKTALKLARNREEVSGYRGDPFLKLEPLDEKRARREPIALKLDRVNIFLAICHSMRRGFGNKVEQMFLTASRVNQVGTVDGAFLRYASQKRGIARAFPLTGRLAIVSRGPFLFSMKLWNVAAKSFGRPELNPHDLRHSRLTIEGNRPEATLFTLQKFGGWRDPLVGRIYLHPDQEAVEANLPHGPRMARRSRGRLKLA